MNTRRRPPVHGSVRGVELISEPLLRLWSERHIGATTPSMIMSPLTQYPLEKETAINDRLVPHGASSSMSKLEG